MAELAAEGLTNSEIAGRLFISRHTVKTHLAHAFQKLGLRSRLELVRTLAERAADEVEIDRDPHGASVRIIVAA